MRYEMRLRELRRVGSLVGLSGSSSPRAKRSAVRGRSMSRAFHDRVHAYSRGLRGESDPQAPGYYRDLAEPGREYARKVRTIVRGLSGLRKHWTLSNPFATGCSRGSCSATNCVAGSCRLRSSPSWCRTPRLRPTGYVSPSVTWLIGTPGIHRKPFACCLMSW